MKRLYYGVVIMTKDDGKTTTNNHELFYGLCDSEDEFRGRCVAKAMQKHPGFRMSGIGLSTVDSETVRAAANAEGGAG